jgi:hypothetical protein
MTPQKAAARLRSTIAAGTGSFLIVEKNLYDMGGTDLVTQVLNELDRLRAMEGELYSARRSIAFLEERVDMTNRQRDAALVENETLKGKLARLTEFAEWCVKDVCPTPTYDERARRANEALGRTV